jgi:hypothetical protein
MGIQQMMLAQGPTGPTDPFWANVVSLINCTDADGTTFTDAKGKTWTAQGGAQVVSNWFVGDGAGDYLSNTGSTDFDFGTGDFTAETFLQTSVKDDVIFDFRHPGSNGIVMYSKVTTGYPGVFTNAGASIEVLGATDLSNNVVRHVAFSRVSGVMYVCVDGAVSGSGAMANNVNSFTGRYFIGAASNGTQAWQGKLRGMRVTKGVGRYSGAYTVPTWPLPTA